MLQLTEEQINALGDEAFNLAIKHIQDTLGVPSGDNAAVFFSGLGDIEIMAILSQYIRYEILLSDFTVEHTPDANE